MSVVGDVIAETGLDVANPLLGETVLTKNFTDRFEGAFPDLVMIGTAMRSAITAVQGMAVSKLTLGGVAGVYAAVLAVAGATKAALEGRLDDAISDNYARLERSRNLAIQTWVAPGDWSVCLPAGGLKVGDVDLYDQAGGWGAQQFLDQYHAGIVWISKRTMRSDILLPTWHSFPFTEGFGFRTGEQGTDFPPESPLTGFYRDLTEKPGAQRLFYAGQPNCAPFPSKYDEDYFGTMPSPTAAELATLQGPNKGAFKGLQALMKKMDEALLKQAFVPPPDYWYCWSIGTYPYTNWSTAASFPMSTGSYCTLNGTMAAMSAGIHSISAIHAAVRSSEVERCYRAWSAAVRLDRLPPLADRQPEPGVVYLKSDGLPFATRDKYGNDTGNIQTYCTKRPGPQDLKSPPGLGPSYCLNWQVVKSIELAFRSFFKIRRAVLYQYKKTNSVFQAAAEVSPDPILAAVAKGGAPPPYKAWSESDPLGDVAVGKPGSFGKPSGVGPSSGGPPGADLLVGGGLASPETPARGGGGVAAGAAALAALAWWRLRR